MTISEYAQNFWWLMTILGIGVGYVLNALLLGNKVKALTKKVETIENEKTNEKQDIKEILVFLKDIVKNVINARVGGGDNSTTENVKSTSGDVKNIQVVTQGEYDALVHKDEKTLYLIKETK